MGSCPQVLSIDGVGKSFGAFRVLDDVSFDVLEGETIGLIGPNGAGKTTLFNIISGFLRAGEGAVHYRGRDITSFGPRQRANEGLIRTFQKSMVFPELTVRENIALALRAQSGSGYRWWSAARAVGAADRRADDIVERVGLAHRLDRVVKNLSYGEQRMVDVLISLALEPRVLLLDEPTAGLARAEADILLESIKLHDNKTSVILIAHDLDIVFSSCDRIAALNLGRLIAVDTPAAIRANDDVRKAYLGAAALS